MGDFVVWIFSSFYELISFLTNETVLVIYNIEDEMVGYGLYNIDINLALFSDIPIIATDLQSLLYLFFSIFYTVIFVVIVWKIIKKVVVKITGWNKW